MSDELELSPDSQAQADGTTEQLTGDESEAQSTTVTEDGNKEKEPSGKIIVP